VIDRIDRLDDAVVVAAHGRARGSRCRRCGRVSIRVHSRYRRHVADLPVSGRPVVLELALGDQGRDLHAMTALRIASRSLSRELVGEPGAGRASRRRSPETPTGVLG
jgi:hypothetical protein